MRNRFAAAAALSALLAFCCAPLSAAPEARPREATVRRVVDGDTFRIDGGEKVRLIGVNCPEYEPWKNYEQPYGREAAEFSRGLLTGRRVRLVPDAEPLDRYGRTLAYVFLEDGRFVNLTLVEEGYARAKDYPPNSAHKKELKDAEKRAKAAGKGLWAKRAAAAA
ncbi:MAG TPA: thermonuclease family protein [Candidatus Eisenbacteria bacterium]|jgi:micrococcal nuclease|nr:thermonuclease family protein [Candidatus Eisenbacteria bacterium]